MTLFTLDVSESRSSGTACCWALALGLVFPPLTTLTFATLPARLRTEGAADQRADAQSRRLDRHRRCWCRCWPATPRRIASELVGQLTPLQCRPGRSAASCPAPDFDARGVGCRDQPPGRDDRLSQRFPRHDDLHLSSSRCSSSCAPGVCAPARSRRMISGVMGRASKGPATAARRAGRSSWCGRSSARISAWRRAPC